MPQHAYKLIPTGKNVTIEERKKEMITFAHITPDLIYLTTLSYY